MDKELQKRKENRPDRINVRKRIQRHASQRSCSVVTQSIRHPGMRCLVQAQRKEQYRKLYGNSADVNVSKYVHSPVPSKCLNISWYKLDTYQLVSLPAF